jgi:hypothetical protein
MVAYVSKDLDVLIDLLLEYKGMMASVVTYV